MTLFTGETRTGTNAYAITYQYDAVGNRAQMIKDGQTTNYAYNNNNQLLTQTASDANVVYAYDNNGNLVSKTDAEDANNNATYTWDWRNMLISVNSVSSVAYSYDGDGNRIQKTESRGQATETTKYINDVGLGLVQVLMETNFDGNALATYTYGNDLIAVQNSEISGYYHYDGLGSTRQLTDSNETLVASYTYDSFGNSVASVSSVANPYGFTGEQQFDEADGLVFLRARYYAPNIGRFISRDPIGYEGGLNLHAYVNNNPINSIDPSGRDEYEDCVADCKKNTTKTLRKQKNI